ASLECKPLIEAARQESATDTDSIGIVDVRKPSGRIEECIGSPAGDTLSEPGMIAVFNALLGLHDAARLEGDMPLARRCLAMARNYAGTARTKLRFANAEGAAFVERGEATRADAAFARGLAIADAAQ